MPYRVIMADEEITLETDTVAEMIALLKKLEQQKEWNPDPKNRCIKIGCMNDHAAGKNYCAVCIEKRRQYTLRKKAERNAAAVERGGPVRREESQAEG